MLTIEQRNHMVLQCVIAHLEENLVTKSNQQADSLSLLLKIRLLDHCCNNFISGNQVINKHRKAILQELINEAEISLGNMMLGVATPLHLEPDSESQPLINKVEVKKHYCSRVKTLIVQESLSIALIFVGLSIAGYSGMKMDYVSETTQSHYSDSRFIIDPVNNLYPIGVTSGVLLVAGGILKCAIDLMKNFGGPRQLCYATASFFHLRRLERNADRYTSDIVGVESMSREPV